MFIQHPKAAAGHPQPDVPAHVFQLFFQNSPETWETSKKNS